MISLVRAGVTAALLVVAPLLSFQSASAAADKAFRNSELADSAVTLEAQIKTDAGTPTKPLPQIRRDADIQHFDRRAGLPRQHIHGSSAGTKIQAHLRGDGGGIGAHAMH